MITWHRLLLTGILIEQEPGRAVKSTLASLTGGGFIATLAEKWMTEGKRNNLLEVIETGLKFRFGTRGMQILPELRKVQDTTVLTAVQEGLWTTDNLDDLRNIYTDCG